MLVDERRSMQLANEYHLEQMRLLEKMLRKIDEWPAEIHALESLYESFGSWSSIIRRDGMRTKVIFDGRDHWLEAKRLPRDAGDFSKPSRHLGGMGLPTGLSADSLPMIVDFIKKHSI